MAVACKTMTRRLRHGCIAAALTLVAATPVSAQTLTAVMASQVTVLDPVLTASHQTRNHAYMVYDTLLATDAQNDIRPQMAERWEVSEDGKVYTFTLRDGLNWHDGLPVLARDCVASIKRWGQQDQMARKLMPLVDSIDAIDERTFQIVLNTPTEALLVALAKPSGLPAFMMPERIAATPASQAITEQVGSGPFKFVAAEFQPGVRAVYLKNEDYVPRDEPPSGMAGGKVVNVDRVEWLVMPDRLTAVNALLSADVDYLESVPFDLVPLLERDDQITTRVLDKMGNHAMYRFNQSQPPFDNKLIRQAAMYAIGQEEALRAQVGDPDYYRTCPALFGCDLPYESDALSEMIVEANPEKARQLLEQAGYENQPVLILQATDVAMSSALPVVMADQLRQAGFNVSVESMDFMTMLSRRSNRDIPARGGWSIFATTWHVSEIMDPLRNYGVSASGDQGWFGWPDVPEVESLRTQFLLADTQEARVSYAQQLQRVMLDEGVTVPLGEITTAAAYRNTITGVLEAPVPSFWNMRKTE